YFHIVVSCRQNLLFHCSILRKPHHLHLLWEIDIASFFILLIDRRQHQFLSQKQLVFNLSCISIRRIIEGQRPEHHLIAQHSFHIRTVEIWDQPITQTNDMPEALCLLKTVHFPLSGSHS